jgi:hypothetical protein
MTDPASTEQDSPLPWWEEPVARPQGTRRRRRNTPVALVGALTAAAVLLATGLVVLWINWGEQHRRLDALNRQVAAAQSQLVHDRADASALQARAKALQASQDAAKELAAARTSALAAARSAAVAFGTYDYQQLNADFAKIKSHLTPEYVAKYEHAADALENSISDARETSAGTVADLALESITTSKASILVFLDQAISTDGAAIKTVHSRVKLTMERDGTGPWLVANLEFL